MIVQDFVVPKMLSNLVPFIFVQKPFTLTSILALQGERRPEILIPTRHVIDTILLKENDVPPERRYIEGAPLLLHLIMGQSVGVETSRQDVD